VSIQFGGPVVDSLPFDIRWEKQLLKRKTRPISHRRRNLSYLAGMLNGDRPVFAPGFNGPDMRRAQRLTQLAGTALQLTKLCFSRNTVEIAGPLHLYGPIGVSIGQAKLKSVLKGICTGSPSILVRGNRSFQPLPKLIEVLGADPSIQMNAKILDNPVLVFECKVRDQAAIIHFGISESGRMSVERHREGLQKLESADLPAEIRAMTARPLQLPCQRSHVLAQTRVDGHPISVRSEPLNVVQQKIEATLQLALRLTKTARIIPQGPDDEFIQKRIRDLPLRVPKQYQKALTPAVEAITCWPNRQALPATLVHGDLWLSNVLFSEHGTPSGLIDWEWCRNDGLPAFDLLQLIFGTLAENRRMPIPQLLAQVWDEPSREPWINALLSQICQKLNLNWEDLVRIALVLWLGIVRRSAVDTTGTSKNWFDLNVLAPSDSFAKSNWLH
jgi:hypothetical protein